MEMGNNIKRPMCKVALVVILVIMEMGNNRKDFAMRVR